MYCNSLLGRNHSFPHHLKKEIVVEFWVNIMTSLDKVLGASPLLLEQQEMLIQILQRRMIERRRDEIAQDAAFSLAEFREGKLKAQTADEAITELRKFLQSE